MESYSHKKLVNGMEWPLEEQKMEETEQVLEAKTEQALRVKCPFCGSIRQIFKPTQIVARCLNPECKTKSGKQRVYWILRRTVKDGVVCEKRINTEN